MKTLVACEFSGTVRDAFIARGHEAMSCDLLPICVLDDNPVWTDDDWSRARPATEFGFDLVRKDARK